MAVFRNGFLPAKFQGSTVYYAKKRGVQECISFCFLLFFIKPPRFSHGHFTLMILILITSEKLLPLNSTLRVTLQPCNTSQWELNFNT